MISVSPMSPDHPRWQEFVSELDRESVCRRSFDGTRAVLERMGGIDVEESLRVLREMGGRCDCEILFGIARLGESLRA